MTGSLKGSLWQGTDNSITGQVFGCGDGELLQRAANRRNSDFFLGVSLSPQCCGFSLSALWGDRT